MPWLALLFSAVSLVLSLAGDAAERALALTPASLGAGELYRLWSGHFVHYGGAHLVGDLLAFAVWAALLESESRRALAWLVLAGAPAISLLVLALCPEVTAYRGLSALDVALVTSLLGRRFVLSAARPRSAAAELGRFLGPSRLFALSAACAFLLLAKTLYELYAGHALLAPDLGTGVRLLPAAHVFGVVIGAGGVLFDAINERGRGRSTLEGGPLDSEATATAEGGP